MEVGWQAVIDGDENEGKLPLDKMEGRGGRCRVHTVGVGVGVDCACRQLSVLTSLVCARWWQ